MYEISKSGMNGFNATINQKIAVNTVSVNQMFVPKKVFFTKGVGKHEDHLVSFELALRDAGIEKFNLVTVSSIYPPGCEIVSIGDGLEKLNPGQIVFCVMSRMTSNEKGKRIFASVGAAVPEDKTRNGYLTEYHGYYNDEDVGKHSENSASYMLETTFDVKNNQTFNITSISEVDKHTTVVAAAVFVF